jgi:hypothetical protein
MKTKPILLALSLLALLPSAHGKLIGDIMFTGQFTTDHLYNFNDPSAQPLGTFGLQTVTNVSGMFSGHVSPGDMLGGAGSLGTVGTTTFTLDGISFSSTGVILAGGMASLLALGEINSITGITLPPDYSSALWFFQAPELNFDHNVTGPIQLEIRAFSPVFVPEEGSTALMFGGAIAGLFLLKRKRLKL